MRPNTISPLQCRDVALALTFLLLLIWVFTKHAYWAYGAMALLLLAMICPTALRGPARIWFGLSHVLGSVMSRVLLGAIYFVILLPVALVRRMMGKDVLGLRRWKAGPESAFVAREHTFAPEDLRHPF